MKKAPTPITNTRPHLDDHHGGVEAGALLNALDQDRGDDDHDQDGGQVDERAGRDEAAGVRV